MEASIAGANLLAAALTTWATLVVGVSAVHTGRLSGWLLAALVLLALAAFDVASPLAGTARQLRELNAAASRLFAVTDAAPPVGDPVSPQPLPTRPQVVALMGASVRYEVGAPRVLDGFDLELRPGRRVAIVGPSGSGKTTVANVLLRFCELEQGRYTINGIDVHDVDQDDVRRVVGLAGQEAHLFDTSIAENVRFARPEATDSDVATALDAAHIGAWVASLPQGLATRVGEQGRRVSGGERQRIALARVLLAGTPVVVLDEPFANLDCDAADALLADLVTATRGRALVLITHRLAGLESFDEVVVLDRGRVVERGTHDQLLRRDGLYRAMWTLEQDVAGIRSMAT